MADQCVKLRNDDNKPHFLVVIPKCDLYMEQSAAVQDPQNPESETEVKPDKAVAGESIQQQSQEESHFFLHGLFEKLKKEQVLYLEEGSSEAGKTYGDLTSRGGTTWKEKAQQRFIR